jgi:hypothetical protein
MNNEFHAWKDFEKNDMDFSLLRIKYSNRNFYLQYNLGFENYINGDWKEAKKYFDNAENILGCKDGPIQNLKKKMEIHDYEIPDNYIF